MVRIGFSRINYENGIIKIGSVNEPQKQEEKPPITNNENKSEETVEASAQDVLAAYAAATNDIAQAPTTETHAPTSNTESNPTTLDDNTKDKAEGSNTPELNNISGVDDLIPKNPENYIYDKQTLLDKGFTKEHLKLYFAESKDGKLALKAGIKVSWYEKPIMDIKTLETVLALNLRKHLKSNGLTDEIIDKYFHIETYEGVYVYRANRNAEVSTDIGAQYAISSEKDGSIKLIINHNGKESQWEGHTIIIHPDGTYEDKGYTKEEFSDKYTRIIDTTKFRPDEKVYLHWLKDLPQSYIDELFTKFDSEKYVLDQSSGINGIIIEKLENGKILIKVTKPSSDGGENEIVSTLTLYSQEFMQQRGYSNDVINQFFIQDPKSGNYIFKEDTFTIDELNRLAAPSINSQHFMHAKQLYITQNFVNGTVYNNEDLKFVQQDIIDKYFTSIGSGQYLLKDNGNLTFNIVRFPRTKTDECPVNGVSVSIQGEINGKIINESVQYYTDIFIQANKLLDETVEKFFDIDYTKGLFRLKEGVTVEDIIKYNDNILTTSRVGCEFNVKPNISKETTETEPTEPTLPAKPEEPQEPISFPPLDKLTPSNSSDYIYNKQSLLDKGFSDLHLKLYFAESEDGKYAFKAGIQVSWFDKPIMDLRTLEAVLALDDRVDLKNRGLTDEVIDKFFHVEKTKYGYLYQANGDYDSTYDGETKYRIIPQNDGTVKLIIFLNGREDYGKSRSITINTDGTYADSGIIDSEWSLREDLEQFIPNQTYKFDKLYDFPQSYIDEYFIETEKGKYTINQDSNANYIKVEKFKEGKVIISITKQDENGKNFVSTTTLYTLDYLKNKGYSELIIGQFFRLDTRTGNYTFKSEFFTYKDLERCAKTYPSSKHYTRSKDTEFTQIFVSGTVYTNEDLKFIHRDMVEKYFICVNDGVYVLKDDGELSVNIIRYPLHYMKLPLNTISVTINGTVGNETVNESILYYPQFFIDSNKFLDSTINMFFDFDKITGLYRLKDGYTIEDATKFNNEIFAQAGIN